MMVIPSAATCCGGFAKALKVVNYLLSTTLSAFSAYIT
jgi:hypothetical protein